MVNEKGMSSSADGTAGNAAGRGRTLWLDCQAGVAGDMLVAALIDAAEDSEAAERAVRLARCPVIAVPTSVGYGANFEGVTALLAMLNSCASGVSVVNIDNGFGAGFQASLINHLPGREA